jgi:type II secretory pathway pseudopilin PulG
MPRRALCIFAVLALAATLTACGSSGASQDELNQARTEGAAQAKQQAKIEGIEKQLKSLKHGGHAPNRPHTYSPGTTAESSGSSCGGELSVGANTTCAFAENVENDYFSEIGSGSGSVVSYSPVTGKLYTMYCTTGEPHECTGGNNASVYFP